MQQWNSQVVRKNHYHEGWIHAQINTSQHEWQHDWPLNEQNKTNYHQNTEEHRKSAILESCGPNMAAGKMV